MEGEPAPHGAAGVVVVQRIAGAAGQLGDHQRMLGVERDGRADHHEGGAQELFRIAPVKVGFQGDVEVDAFCGSKVNRADCCASSHDLDVVAPHPREREIGPPPSLGRAALDVEGANARPCASDTLCEPVEKERDVVTLIAI
jgi:hypothetical protein